MLAAPSLLDTEDAQAGRAQPQESVSLAAVAAALEEQPLALASEAAEALLPSAAAA